MTGAIAVGSTVRYVGDRKPLFAGAEGRAEALEGGRARIAWAHHARAAREGRKPLPSTWEPIGELRPIRKLTKGFAYPAPDAERETDLRGVQERLADAMKGKG